MWADVPDGVEVELEESHTLLAVSNNSDEQLSVELDWVGDLGTTRTYKGTLEPVLVAPGSQATVAVELASLFPTLESTYSGYFHVIGRSTSAVENGELDQVISPGLYFHQSAGKTFVYDEFVLRGAHRAGDFDGLVAATEQLLDEGQDSETVRVVAYESEENTEEGANDDWVEPGLSEAADPSQLLVSKTKTQESSYAHHFCAQYQVQTVDSGYTNSVGITEDRWSTANAGSIVPAAGARVVIGTATYDTDNNGCVTFYLPVPVFSASVRIYAYVSFANGNSLRMHNAASNTTASYPGATYSILVSGVNFITGIPSAVPVGNYTPRWTAMGASTESLLRYADGLSDTAFHVSDLGGQNPVEFADCNANFNYLNSISGKRSYIRFVTANAAFCPVHNQRHKFVVSHEYGHGYGHQVAGVAEQSPASPNHAVAPSGCAFSGSFVYDNNTKEWGSIGIREGFAHFVSARIWNDAAPDGQFRWGSSFDLERYTTGNPAGGYLVNECCRDGVHGTPSTCANSLNGAATLTDWMRAFWDQHTDGTCPLGRWEMALLYGLTIDASGLTNSNYWDKSQLAMGWFWGLFGGTCSARWDFNGCWNGIDRRGALWSGC